MRNYSKTAIITGISGQDGLISTDILIARDWNIVGVTRNPNSKRVSELKSLHSSIKFIELDYTRDFYPNLIKEYKPNLFLHWGSPSSVVNPWSDATDTFADLVMSSCSILQGIVDNSMNETALMLPVSSEIFSKDGLGKTADSPRELKSIYATGKSSILDLANLYREKYDIQIYSPILFPHESPLRNGDFFTKRIMDAIIEVRNNFGIRLPIGDLNAKRDWSWAPSVVSYIIDEIERGSNTTKTIGSGSLITTSKVIESFFSAARISDWRDHFIVDQGQVRTEGALGNFARLESENLFTQPALEEWSKMYVESTLNGKFLNYSTV